MYVISIGNLQSEIGNHSTLMTLHTTSIPLGFGFVTPFFFWSGALLVSIPILIHILNRRRFKIVDWAAMEFLLRAMKKNRRRLKFEQMVLLATRCLVLLLLGIALARPLGCDQSSIANLAGRRTGLHVFVIDNSYSMSYEADRPNAKTHLDQAKAIAKAIVDRLASGGESVAVITTAPASPAVDPEADGHAPKSQTVLPPTYDLKEADAAIDRIEPSFAGTDLAGALARARDVAATETRQPSRSLYILDDSTRVAYAASSDQLGQTGRELVDLYKVGITHYDLSKQGQWNQAVVDVRPTSDLITTRFPVDVLADARGFGTSATDPQLIWRLDDEVVPPGAATVQLGPDEHDQQITLSGLHGGTHVLTANLIGDDRLKLDDTRYRVIDVASQVKVLIVEGERGNGPLDSSGVFLDQALNPRTGPDTAANQNSASYVSTERISDLELGNKVLGDYRCIALCGVGGIQEAEAAALEKYVQQGGAVMVFMGDPVTAENYNATLYKHHLLPGPLTKKVNITGDQPGRTFDFNPKTENPFLPGFTGQENTGLDTTEIFGYWQVDLPADAKAFRVLNFVAPDDKTVHDPAITVHSLGQGKVLFFATSAGSNPNWSEFPAKPNYPALMHELLLHLVNGNDGWMNLTVGDPLTLPPQLKLTGAPTLKDVAGTDIPLQQVTGPDGQGVYRSRPLTKPGVYTLSTGQDAYKIAVNVPGAEADVRTIDGKAVRKALGDIDLKLEGDSVPAETVSANQGKDLGWSVMLGVLALVAAESFMAMRFGHTRRK